MEPFTVVCSTCQSRIRVRNIGLVGQLVNCPKCNSMVLITSPGQTAQEASGPISVDSRAITREGIDLQDGLFATDSSMDLDEYRLLSPDDLGVQSNQSGGVPDFSNIDAIDLPVGSAIAAPPIQWNTPDRASPSQAWTSEKPDRKRQVLLVVAIGSASLLLTGGLLVLFLRWANQAPQPVTTNVAQVAPGDSLEHTVRNNQQTNAATDSNSESLDANPEVVDNTTPDLPEGTGESVAADIASSEPDSVGVADLADSSVPQEAPKSDVNSEQSEVTSDNGEQEMQPVQPLPSKLSELAQLIGQPFEFAVPQTLAIPEKAPVTAEELGIREASFDKSLPRIDLHAMANELKIRGLRIDDVPLPHAINYLSLASGLPVIVDANSLMLANANRSQPVSLVLNDGTAFSCLQQFAQKIELQLQPVDNQFYRLYAQQPDSNLLPLQHDFGDLLSDDTGREWMQSTIAQLFPHVVEGITVENSKLVANPEKVAIDSWFALVRTLENWRAQLGLPTGLTQYQPENLRVPFVRPSELNGLDQVLDQVESGPRTLASLVNSLCSRVGIECWVDWPSLRTLGLEPNTLISTITYKRPLKSILKELALEHNVVSVLIDEKSLWLTSSPTHRASPEIFVIPSESRELDYWEQFIRPLTPVVAGGVSKAVLLMTPDGKFLFVKCCRPTIDFN